MIGSLVKSCSEDFGSQGCFLNLPISENCQTIQALIDEYLILKTETEICQKCKKMCKIEKQKRIQSSSNILIIRLLRTDDGKNGRKIHTKVNPDHSLRSQSFTSLMADLRQDINGGFCILQMH